MILEKIILFVSLVNTNKRNSSVYTVGCLFGSYYFLHYFLNCITFGYIPTQQDVYSIYYIICKNILCTLLFSINYLVMLTRVSQSSNVPMFDSESKIIILYSYCHYYWDNGGDGCDIIIVINFTHTHACSGGERLLRVKLG